MIPSILLATEVFVFYGSGITGFVISQSFSSDKEESLPDYYHERECIFMDKKANTFQNLNRTIETMQTLERIEQTLSQVILGKREKIKLALTCLLAEGHLLIEDIPGVGKTTLVKALAVIFGIDARRIQFTNDLLPGDILGSSVFNSQKQIFDFHPGPIFGQMIIADELNRATPKTQSALLQAMEERRVSVDGKTYLLPQPFFVVATQNPYEQLGTYMLPESQVDRFMMKIKLGYPDREAEGRLLQGQSVLPILENIKPLASVEQLIEWQKAVQKVTVSQPLVHYLQDLLDWTRSSQNKVYGLSPRSGLAWLKAAKAWAYLSNRSFVTPADLQSVGVAIMSHRIAQRQNTEQSENLAQKVLDSVRVVS